MTTGSRDRLHLLKPHLSRGRIAGAGIFVVFAAVSLAIGLDGALSVVLLCAVFAALVLYVPSRGDITSIMTGEADERQRMIDLRASWFTLQAVAFTAIAGYLWELGHDRSGVQFLVVALVSTVAYVTALFVLRSRS